MNSKIVNSICILLSIYWLCCLIVINTKPKPLHETVKLPHPSKENYDKYYIRRIPIAQEFDSFTEITGSIEFSECDIVTAKKWNDGWANIIN